MADEATTKNMLRLAKAMQALIEMGEHVEMSDPKDGMSAEEIAEERKDGDPLEPERKATRFTLSRVWHHYDWGEDDEWCCQLVVDDPDGWSEPIVYTTGIDPLDMIERAITEYRAWCARHAVNEEVRG